MTEPKLQKEVYSRFPAFRPDQPASNLLTLIEEIPPYDPKLQENPVFEDVDEAVLFESFLQNPEDMTHIPFGISHTEDSQIGEKLLTDYVKNFVKSETFILEDGCGNGQHLVSLVSTFMDEKIPVRAWGTDIVSHNTNIGQLLINSIGMNESVRFSAGHSLHRKSPRAISGITGTHITLGYRLIPVFPEQKILRYMRKISSEMQPGDLWCGSIALPEGRFYKRNISDEQSIKQFSIRPVNTSFGGTTFVHHPNFGKMTDPAVCAHFNSRYKVIGLQLNEKDFSNVVLNTYMTRTHFENLAKNHGLEFATDPIEVDCSDNKRLVVLLRKT